MNIREVTFLFFFALYCSAVLSYTTRSYDLEVPGSRPIRIFESDFNQDRRNRVYRPDLDQREHHDNDYDYNDPSNKLKDFLQNYADKIKKKKVPLGDESHSVEEENDEEIDEQNEGKREKPKAWNLMHVNSNFEKPKNPHNDEKGWVSMEAVPWSVSKISKWQSKPDTEKDDFYPQIITRPHRPSYEIQNKPVRHKPASYYNNEEEEPEEDFKRKPPYHRPSALYGQKVHVHTVLDYGDVGKPWEKHSHTKQDCDKHKYHQQQPQIITDGLPPNFPDHQDYSNRRRGSTNDYLPQTHPFKGEGEWVLLSTTKGYKYPKTRQRSMRLDSSPNNAVDNNAIDTHKSVKLTVLPPLKSSKINMTTSHGGLLQVESTFETVDESHKAYLKKQKLKNKNQIRKGLALNGKPSNPKITNKNQFEEGEQHDVQYQAFDRDVSHSHDTASVLAAVGAGMIPASMALLVPMAMGGRRRRDIHLPNRPKFVTSSPYLNNFELTLPRSF